LSDDQHLRPFGHLTGIGFSGGVLVLILDVKLHGRLGLELTNSGFNDRVVTINDDASWRHHGIRVGDAHVCEFAEAIVDLQAINGSLAGVLENGLGHREAPPRASLSPYTL